MNEIDDLYKEEGENLDNEFLESHNLGITKASTLNRYLSGLKKSRKKFEKSYARHLKKEKWKTWHQKKKKKKKSKKTHLKVKHFNFEFNAFQKILMKLNVFGFTVKRIFSKSFVKIFPKLLFYVIFKIVKVTRALFRDVGLFIDKVKARVKAAIVKFFKDLFAKIKEKLEKIKKKLAGNAKKISDFIYKITGKKKEGEEDKDKKTEEKKEESS